MFYGLAVYPAFQAPPHPDDAGPIREIDVSGYPVKLKKAYQVFLKTCSQCHPTSRIYNSKLKGEQWIDYIKRMMIYPGANITLQEATVIAEFVIYYSDKNKD